MVIWDTWRAAGIPLVNMSINISGRHFRQGNLIDTLKANIRCFDLAPEYITVEITETSLIKSQQYALKTLLRLRDLGISISLDDFGTGYSSLSYLSSYPINKLKIDRSFVTEVHCDSDKAAIINAIIAMSHTLNLSVTAEGVETVEELAFLKDRKCDIVQGYYFSRPLSPEDAGK
nr:EAL domain-containing protein [Candidatus Reidiella endopervernicosa]